MCAWYYIKNRSSGLNLEVINPSANDGTPVYPQKQATGSNQKWYTDGGTSTIRTVINDSCLDIVNGQAVVNVLSGKTGQQWMIKAGQIVNQRTKMVLAVSGKGEDARVIETDDVPNDSTQEWTFPTAT